SFFCNSGAEAVECAIKLARKWGRTERGVTSPTIVAADGGFHGRTLGALAATGQPGKQAPFAPMVPGFVHVPFGDADALERAFDPSVVAVLLEPIQGEAGIVVPPGGYLARAAELCAANDVLLVLDEVQTGMGRTGRWFAHQHHDVVPDVMCLAKGLAGGLPMGACLAAQRLAGVLEPGDHGSTFGGGPVQSAAALAVLDVIGSEGLVERARELGPYLAQGLERAFGGAPVRGKGLMLAVELPGPVARSVTEAALEAGVLVNDPAPDVIRVTPPLVIERDQIDDALNVLEEVWGAVRPS
ncbi:MAG TPA: aminotransferase class III-fold pyridoxal phosphate-dependent enzyme, partial [Actinomycetota bacterium]|nr:aminotransferase class III-fold pyridoxal phosphate-dependent enzyme [Actinomycetota bacterium]